MSAGRSEGAEVCRESAEGRREGVEGTGTSCVCICVACVVCVYFVDEQYEREW